MCQNIIYFCRSVSACGSIDCPWVIQAKPGQKIRLDLYDFNTYYSDSGQSVNKLGVDFSHTCHVYVIIKEERNSMTACAEGIRQRHIYTTDSNRVEIRVVTKRKSTAETQFLLNYTGLCALCFVYWQAIDRAVKCI